MRAPFKTAALALLLAAFWATPVQAQSQAAKKDLIQKVLNLQKAAHEPFAVSLAQGTVQPLIQNAGQVLQAKVPEDKREALAKAMDEEIRAYFRDVVPVLRAAVTKNAAAIVGAKLESDFSEADLKQLIQFLESPAVRRYQQMGADLNGAVAQKVMQESGRTIETRAKALDQKLVEMLGLKPPAAPAASATKP